jgi:ATP-dependent DNA ligase
MTNRTSPFRTSCSPSIAIEARREALAAEGAVVFAKACEGIVSKRAGSFYGCGRSRNWLKTKNPDFART